MSKKSPKTVIKEQALEIEELKKKVEHLDTQKQNNWDKYMEAEKELESVHAALDTMFVPRKIKIGYQEKSMTIASRLFAWQAGAKIDPTPKTEIE